MPNFSTPQKILQFIRQGEDAEATRSENRAKVNRAANGFPPLPEEEAKKLGIKINVNWGELLVLLTHATGQLLNAFLGNQYFFTVKIPIAPEEHKSEWEAFITAEINRPLRESLTFFELHRSRWASVVSHGVGISVWPNPKRWEPEFRPQCDVRIPTDTTLDFKNLEAYAERHNWGVMELLDEVFNDKPGNKWNKKAVARILKNVKDLNETQAPNNYNWETDYEKLAEVLKQDGSLGSSTALPTIPLWHFFFKDNTGDRKGLFMRVVPELTANPGATDAEFLWTSDEPVAPTWKQLIHCQYGDLNSTAPFKYNAIRGLGFLLLEPTFYDNLTICRMLQHMFDNFNVWLRTVDNPDKARKAVQEFGDYKVVSQGTSVVPNNERHQVDPQFVEMGLAKMKQLQQEASSSYTQQTDTGTKKEQTAFETRVKMEQVNAMMGSILRIAFKYESYFHREICRRFCLENTDDDDILTFQKSCEDFKIPRQFLNVKYWEVEPVTPLGQGNPTIAQAAAQQLMQNRGAYSPQAQAKILHDFTLVTTGDPRKAQDLAPISGRVLQSDAKREAIGLFGTLMTGVSVPLMESNLLDQIDALMPLLAGKIVQIEKRDNMADHAEASGLQNVGTYIGQAIEQLAQDPMQKEKVKLYKDSLGKLMNQVKGVAQRGTEAAQSKGNGDDAELQGKLRNDAVLTQAKANALKAKTGQKMHLDEIKFRAGQRREDAKTYADIQHERFRTMAEAHNNRIKQEHSFNGEPTE